jgi:hypothetical protein
VASGFQHEHFPDMIPVFRQPVFFMDHLVSGNMRHAGGDHPGGFAHGVRVNRGDVVSKIHDGFLLQKNAGFQMCFAWNPA